jgi:hypothetical protein
VLGELTRFKSTEKETDGPHNRNPRNVPNEEKNQTENNQMPPMLVRPSLTRPMGRAPQIARTFADGVVNEVGIGRPKLEN